MLAKSTVFPSMGSVQHKRKALAFEEGTHQKRLTKRTAKMIEAPGAQRRRQVKSWLVNIQEKQRAADMCLKREVLSKQKKNKRPSDTSKNVSLRAKNNM